MNTAETRPHPPAPLPDPAVHGPATETHLSAGEPAGVADGPSNWLLDLVVEGFLHCACAHQAVHPDLIGCIGQRARERTATEESLS